MVFSEDEEYKRVSFDKFATLKPVFQKENGNPSYFILVIYLVKIWPEKVWLLLASRFVVCTVGL